MLPAILRDQSLNVLHNISQQQGVVQIYLGPKSIYVVSDPDAFQYILRDNHHNYRKPDMFYGALKKILGNGLVTSEGAFWLRQRRMIQPFMHRKYLTGLTEIMVEGITEILDTWEDYVDCDKEIDLDVQMKHIAINVITKSMFGQDITVEERDTVSRLIPGILDYFNIRGFLPFVPEWIPLPGDHTFASNYAEARYLIMNLIEKRRNDNSEAVDLISMLLNTVDDETNEGMTDNQLLDEALTIFGAGFETTSSTLTWLWNILGQYPEVEQKLRSEIQIVLGDRTPTVEDIHNLQYTKMVISETLRMFPAAILLPRSTINEDWIGNQYIPANSIIILYYYGLHHNPLIWEDPEIFRPERFHPEASIGRSQFAWLPFSAGPRKCIGDEFAMMEMLLTVAMIIQRYNMKITAYNNEPRIGTTSLPAYKPILGTIQRR